jgi:hypothetical protein
MKLRTYIKKKSTTEFDFFVQDWKNGTFAKDQTGTYKFFPAHSNPAGYLDEWYLQVVLNMLKKLNRKKVAVPE